MKSLHVPAFLKTNAENVSLELKNLADFSETLILFSKIRLTWKTRLILDLDSEFFGENSESQSWIQKIVWKILPSLKNFPQGLILNLKSQISYSRRRLQFRREPLHQNNSFKMSSLR